MGRSNYNKIALGDKIKTGILNNIKKQMSLFVAWEWTGSTAASSANLCVQMETKITITKPFQHNTDAIWMAIKTNSKKQEAKQGNST
jgi:putative salt-induced outer membrane protein YdiY